ncbi:MAG: glycosyltransferase family 2 protein [Anaerolineaceae bacterium]|nr:glycosyltransferase family 2 protein [Anaerolineaceae bacterium]
MIVFLFWLCVALILYVYILYPVILYLLARLFFMPLQGSKDETLPLPTVTLLISAYNEEAVIAQKIENSLAIDYPAGQLQILVAVDGQEDHTYEIVQKFATQGVDLSYSPERKGKINAIQRGVKAARGDIIVLTDANTFFAPDALRSLMAPLADPEVGAVSGAKVIAQQGDSLANSEGSYWKYESFIKKQETRLGSCTGVSGEILALRRTLFESPPPRLINDDFFLAMQVLRKGYRVVYAPHAMTYERISPSAKDEATRRARIAAGRYQALWMGARLLPINKPQLIWQVFSHKFLRLIVPFAMLGAFLANLAAVLWPVKDEAYAWLRLSGTAGYVWLALQVLFYGIAWLGSRLQHKQKASSLEKILYLPGFLVNSNLAAVSGLILYLSGRQTNLWQRVARQLD